MSFAGILGAGLLGGAASAAKGAGDRIREEAKQKRAFALQDRADKKAQGLADTANDRAVEAATQARIHQAREGRLNRHQQSQMQIGAADIAAEAATVGNDRGVVNDETATVVAENVAAVANDNVVTNAATATVVAENVAEVSNNNAVTNAATAAGVAANVALTQSQVNIAAAEQLAIINAERAKTLGIVQMEQLTANNEAALVRIRAGKVGDVHTFFDETSGLEYKGVTQADGTFKTEGGTKASSASANSYTLQNIKIDGKEVAGFMDGKNWVTVGKPVDKDSANGTPSGHKPKDAQDYFTKEAWKHAGVKTDTYGDPINVSEEDSTLVSGWVSDSMAEWRKGSMKEDPSAVLSRTFYRPLDLDKIEPNDADIVAANARYEDEASAMQSDKNQFGTTESNIKATWARQNAQARVQTTIQNAQDAVNQGADFTEVSRRLRDAGIDPRFIRPKT